MYYQKRISEVMKACETSENGLSHEEIIKRHQQFGFDAALVGTDLQLVFGKLRR